MNRRLRSTLLSCIQKYRILILVPHVGMVFSSGLLEGLFWRSPGPGAVSGHMTAYRAGSCAPLERDHPWFVGLFQPYIVWWAWLCSVFVYKPRYGRQSAGPSCIISSFLSLVQPKQLTKIPHALLQPLWESHNRTAFSAEYLPPCTEHFRVDRISNWVPVVRNVVTCHHEW